MNQEVRPEISTRENNEIERNEKSVTRCVCVEQHQHLVPDAEAPIYENVAFFKVLQNQEPCEFVYCIILYCQ